MHQCRSVAGEVLVRVCATGITPAELTWDASYQHADGTPWIPGIPGHEVSGVVGRSASNVTDFRPDDEVYRLTDLPRDGARVRGSSAGQPGVGSHSASRTDRPQPCRADGLAGALRTCEPHYWTKRANFRSQKRPPYRVRTGHKSRPASALEIVIRPPFLKRAFRAVRCLRVCRSRSAGRPLEWNRSES
jgi:hypothetical protein